MNLVDQVKQAGVVGAGGAGFPTHVKLSAKVEWYLANGAECEPLMHKDRELMTHFASEILQGLKLSAAAVGAEKLAIGLKEKNQDAVAALEKVILRSDVFIHRFGDFYPVGDEYELVYSITGRLIPPAGIPLDIGVVVNNVETLFNVYQASLGKPVTEKFLTIAGLVKNPLTTRVPIGMLVEDVLALAGGAKVSEFAVMESGLMMGKPVKDLSQPVSKTTGGLIVLPKEHSLITRYQTPPKAMDRIGQSACDQCSYCTELCPRYLLGYEVLPHLVMRSLGFSIMGKELWNQYSLLCCKCGICTLYSCPEALFPREACVRGIEDLRSIGKGKWGGSKEMKVHSLKEDRRLPLKQLMNRLGVAQYESHAGYVEVEAQPDQVHIPLQQHTGDPATPAVKVGDRVRKGQMIGQMQEKQLGAHVHASIDGRVRDIKDGMVIIERVK